MRYLETGVRFGIIGLEVVLQVVLTVVLFRYFSGRFVWIDGIIRLLSIITVIPVKIFI